MASRVFLFIPNLIVLYAYFRYNHWPGWMERDFQPPESAILCEIAHSGNSSHSAEISQSWRCMFKGYFRVFLAFTSFYYMPFDPGKAVICYILSELMDALDGYTARRYNQSSSFGAVLDMVTDRISTLGLIMALSLFNSDRIFVYQFLAILDISSHWLQMYGALLVGEKSHKGSRNFFLNLYYSNKIVLFSMCAGNELFLIGTYLQCFSVGPLVNILGYQKGSWELISLLSLPIFLLKQIVNVVQLVAAAQQIASTDDKTVVVGGGGLELVKE